MPCPPTSDRIFISSCCIPKEQGICSVTEHLHLAGRLANIRVIQSQLFITVTGVPRARKRDRVAPHILPLVSTDSVPLQGWREASAMPQDPAKHQGVVFLFPCVSITAQSHHGYALTKPLGLESIVSALSFLESIQPTPSLAQDCGMLHGVSCSLLSVGRRKGHTEPAQGEIPIGNSKSGLH